MVVKVKVLKEVQRDLRHDKGGGGGGGVGGCGGVSITVNG